MARVFKTSRGATFCKRKIKIWRMWKDQAGVKLVAQEMFCLAILSCRFLFCLMIVLGPSFTS